MKVEQLEITVLDLVTDYADDGEGGVRGYYGKLDIRPPFQREFVYKDKKRNAVIDTVLKGFPLNVMYWADLSNDRFEIIDGQQRTISIAQYFAGDFSVKTGSPPRALYFGNLPKDIRDQFLGYPLMIYVCNGTDSEKLAWFRIVNIAGEQLTNQELRNAVYSGSWISDAKRYFSKNNGPAHQIGRDYIKGSPRRQEYLERVIQWISQGNVEEYMGRHQNDSDAKELWEYYQGVIDWIERTFIKKRKEMKSVGWGSLHRQFKDKILDPQAIEEEVNNLYIDEEVTQKSGIYLYVLDRNEKHLNLRSFPDHMRQIAFDKQEGLCAICKKEFDMKAMEADHIKPWSEGGKTNQENCQMLCKPCNREKSNN